MQAPHRDPREETGTVGSPRLAALVLVLAGAAVWANGLRGPFVFDDVPGIVQNEHLERLWPPSRSFDAPEGSGADGRPLVAFSLALNHAIGGRDPLGYHVANLALHLAAALSLFGLVGRATGSLAAGFWTALVWELHPLHTSALHHVVYRNETMMALLLFTSLLAAVRGFREPSRRRVFFTLSVMAMAASAASKEVAVVGPLLVLGLDRLLASKTFAGALRRHTGLYVGLAATWLLLAWFVSTGSRGPSVERGLEALTPLDSLRTQTGAIVHYLRLAFWPDALALDYEGWPITRSWSDVAPAAVLVLLALATGLVALARNTAAGFLASAFFLLLAPTSSVIPLSGALVAEHRMVAPLATLVLLVGLAARRLELRLDARPGTRALRGRKTFALALAAALALGARTVVRNRDFADAVSLWRSTVEVRPDNPRAWNSLGAALAAEGRAAEAEHAYERTLELAPGHFKALVNLGNLALARGELARAERLYARAAEHPADVTDAHYYLGAIALQRGQHALAVRELERALAGELSRDLRVPARQLLGWTLATSPVEGVRDAERALALARELAGGESPPGPRALDLLAAAQAEAGRFEEAAATARRALERVRGDSALGAAIRGRLATYERGRPWREAP